MIEALCPWEAPKYLIFSSNIPRLFFYSHIPFVLIALIFGLVIYSRNKHSSVARSLLVVISLFTIWVFADLVLWATNNPSDVVFYWSLQVIIEPTIYLIGALLTYRFAYKIDPPIKRKIFAVILMLPLIVFLPTKYNISSVTLTDCNAIEGFFAHYYSYAIELIFITAIIATTVRSYKKYSDVITRNQIKYFGIGIITYLIAFSAGNIIGSFFDNWVLAQASLIGMPIFVGFISYLIVKFKIFNIKLVGVEALITIIGLLVFSLLFLKRLQSVKIIVTVTLLFIIFIGRIVIKSVRKEIEQSDQLEKESQDKMEVTEDLYKRNAELAIKNKALSLLGKLYAVSIQTMKHTDLANSLALQVRDSLNYEHVSIFYYDEHNDSIVKIGLAVSERFSAQLRLSGNNLENLVIDKASTRSFYLPIIKNKHPELKENFGYILKNVMPESSIKKLADAAHLKSSVIYPLTIGEKVLGIFVVGMNREYDSLPEYEKEIIPAIVNVISLSIEKSMIYEELKDANEKLQSLDKLKTEFLSLASHQLRSPLTAIKGYTSMLLDGDFGAVGEKQKEAIDRVFQSSVHLAHVVEDLLNVSKIEAGGMQYLMSPFDLEKAAKDLTTDLSITAQKKGLSLNFTTDNKSPYTMIGDMEKIRQVILNIIDNSIKYTQQGSISVSLSKDESAKIMRVSIKDTGMGISPEEKDKLFQKFSRGEGGKTNTGGSGLGLYLAKQISEAHGGRIVIDSPGVGKGSTFTIELASIPQIQSK